MYLIINSVQCKNTKIHSFDKYLLNTDYLSITFLSAKN